MNAKTEIAAEVEAREDLYYAVHKGIRLANARMLIALGRLDPADEEAVVETLTALSAHLDLSLSHLEHENREIHTAIDARCPGSSDHAAEDHDDHLHAFGELRRLAEDVASATVDRPACLRRLYQRFALFFANDLLHMHEEETDLMPLMERNFSNEELAGIHQRIVQSIPLPEMIRYGRIMLGAASAPERVAMVTGMEMGLPSEAFSVLMGGIVGKAWRMGDWQALDSAVN
ncbi:hypothetical protein [Roseibium aggregatum]|uniref:Hemerythrin-like domain-containing protein n=1 Tax=Roseibium aggregatum TaxID=187304 RepID=A0A926NP82_9HYPH|nr:hypothetical protein [Roseibium aggregatum]MBD1544827.1 hypothetical protein [Roseibium aggregatum]